MTPDDVERLALTLPGTTRDPKWGKLGFHRQRLFAILHDDKTLYLRLSPAQQAMLVAQAPTVFSLFEGTGPQGLTVVAIDRIDAATLASAIKSAWEHGETSDQGGAWNG